MPTLMEMLDAGVHFGHKKERSHPKMKDYTFSLREGIFIIDLDQTKELLAAALDYLKKAVAEGKNVLFVGTKRQAKEIVQKTAEAAGMPYVTKRWLGGTLTNFATVRRSITEMERLEAQTVSPEFAAITKKEKKIVTDKLAKLTNTFGGVREMKDLPDVVFVVDANREQLAIDEAYRVGIPVIAMGDTDADPTNIAYLIPANDDAIKSIELVMAEVAAVFGGKKIEKVVEETSEPKEETKDVIEAEKTEKPKVTKKVVKKAPSTKLRAGSKK